VAGCERVIIAGSTWPKDEKLLAEYIENLRLEIGDCRTKLIIVPHEIDEKRLHYIFNLFKGRFVRYSTATRDSMIHADVMVMDTMGLLSSAYRYGHVAYVGGGFGVGIHNTIEAAVYGLPVIFGPHYQHFREAQGLIDAGAARSITNYAEFEAAMDTALDNYQAIGAKAAEYVEAEIGATEKIYNAIFG
jgi:3-deoxy-D-manno-octulosonic-acid transferase